MKIDVVSNRRMFEQSLEWLKTVKYKDVDLTNEEIVRLFEEEFKCMLVFDHLLLKYSAAEFNTEEDASMFILKWS